MRWVRRVLGVFRGVCPVQRHHQYLGQVPLE